MHIRSQVTRDHEKGAAIVANTCEIHYGALAFAQNSGVMAGSWDMSNNFQCVTKVEGEARTIKQ